METFIAYLLSWKFIAIIAMILGYRIVSKTTKRYLDIKEAEMNISRDSLIKDIKYSEDEIISHLDNIITETIDEYMLMNVASKEITYINNTEETKIREFVADEIPKRISGTLMSNLSFIYNHDFLGEYIGKRIYTLVLAKVLEFNGQEPGKGTLPNLTRT